VCCVYDSDRGTKPRNAKITASCLEYFSDGWLELFWPNHNSDSEHKF